MMFTILVFSHSSPLYDFLFQYMSLYLCRGVLHNQPVMYLYPRLANCWLVDLFPTVCHKLQKKTPVETYVPNVLYKCPKNASKT